MPRAEEPQHARLALDVLREELDALDAGFEALERTGESGEREARRSDVLRDLDRYLRLESEVFYPVLAREGVAYDTAAASNRRLRDRLSRLAGDGRPETTAELRSALRAHREQQEADLFPRAARAPGGDLPGLALELDEARDRMKGAYGV